MNKSQWTCSTCPGPDRCARAEAEDCLAELCKVKIRQELQEVGWMLSTHASEGDLLEPADLHAMLVLQSSLQKVLLNDSPDALFSVARQITESRRLQNAAH